MTPHRSLPLWRVDGCLPIEDHGLIGDGTTAALVGRDGAVSWLCIPRFDSPPLSCGLLDRVRDGAFTVAPEPLLDNRQGYEEDIAVLVTELRGPDGALQITDALTLRAGADLTEDAPAGRGELLRRVTVPHRRVRLRVELEPRDGAFATRRAEGLALRLRTRPGLALHLASSRPLEGLRSSLELTAGDRLNLVLRWGGASMFSRRTLEQLLEATRAAWRGWLDCFHDSGPREPLVRRSAITLKLCDHLANGAMVASPTTPGWWRPQPPAPNPWMPAAGCWTGTDPTSPPTTWRATRAPSCYSLWLIDNLAGQGRLEEAAALYESLCDRATPLGLLAEQSIRPAVRSWGTSPGLQPHRGHLQRPQPGPSRYQSVIGSRPPGGRSGSGTAVAGRSRGGSGAPAALVDRAG